MCSGVGPAYRGDQLTENYGRGNITLIPREATQQKEKEILNPQPEKLKKNEKENKNMK